jgi:hypothetical protein
MRRARGLLPVLPVLAASIASSTASAAPELVYTALEAEAAGEYQVGDQAFGPGFLRLTGTAEVAFTEALSGKATISPCLGPYSRQPEGVTQCSPERIVEVLTLNGVGERYDFSLGRQIVTVGNTEGFVMLDRFNGRDLCRFARLDTDNKLPNWLARARAFAGDATLTLTYAPYSAESELPEPGSYCADTFTGLSQFDDLSDPDSDTWSDWAGGAELAITRDRWSASLDAISTREELFGIQTLPTLRKTRPRTLWLGGNWSVTLADIVLRGEVAYTPQREFTLTPAATGQLLMQGLGTDGTEERWNLSTVIAVEMRPGDWYWSLQYFDDQIQGGPALVVDRRGRMLSLRVNRTFANERFALSTFSVLDLEYQDFAIRAALAYEINASTTFEIGGTAYADNGSETGLFGSYAGRGSLFATLQRRL